MKKHLLAIRQPLELSNSPLAFGNIDDYLEGTEVTLYRDNRHIEHLSPFYTQCEKILETCYEYVGSYSYPDLGEKSELIALSLAFLGHDLSVEDPDIQETLLNLYYKMQEKHEETDLILILMNGIQQETEYAESILRGYCQGDWMYCIHPIDYPIDILEADLFNKGEEYEIIELDEKPTIEQDMINNIDIDSAIEDSYYMYCYNIYKEDELLKEIATKAGYEEEDITILKKELATCYRYDVI